MKKIIALLLVIFMLIPLCLTACNSTDGETEGTKPTQSTSATTKPTGTTGGDQNDQGGDEGGNENQGGNENEGGEQTPSDPENPEKPTDPTDPVVLEREVSYLPEDILAQMTGLFENNATGGTSYWMDGAPYTLRDRQSFKGKTLASISLAVSETKGVSDGNFIFTLYIFKDTPEAIAASSPLRAYKIKVSAEKYGLTANTKNIFKLIKVDLSDYNITVAEDEIMSFADKTDTLILAYAEGSNSIYKLFARDFSLMRGFSLKVGREAWNPSSDNALIFNFTFAEKYESKEEYTANATFEEMLEIVKGVYGGKYVSAFGDSISTLKGVSNSIKYNATIADNATYYYIGRNATNSPERIGDTYWGRFVTLGGMNLCVNNSWSGDALGNNRYINRIQQLHNVNGTNPDLILIYFGINDASNQAQSYMGELVTLLENRGSNSEEQVINVWLNSLIADKENYDSFDFAERYAYMLYLATQKYANAKFACVSLVNNKISERKGYDVEKYNAVIKALANYFGALYVEQCNVITKDNRAFYTMDGDYVHPNISGHRVIFEEIVRTLYADIISDPNYKPSKYPAEDKNENDGYTVQSTYVPKSTMDKFVGIFELNKANGTAYALGAGPFAFNDIESFKNKRITSISIPVMATGAADANGCFTFTLSVFKSDLASIQNSAALRTYQLKIPAVENGLAENASNIYRFVTLDLRSYNIVIAEDEILCFGISGDTLLPGYIVDNGCVNPLGKLMKKEVAYMAGFTLGVGHTAWNPDGDPKSPGTNSLLFDFTFETTYESKAAYEATLKEEEDFEKMLEAVKDAYAGKNYSVFGDSISTYTGISNNTAYNTTIAGNALWYGNRGRGGLYDHTYTYWGSFTRLANMNLCVSNAWSGDWLGSGKFRTRAVNLHNNTGATAVNPDLIFVYIGTNDISTWGGQRSASEWKVLYDELLGLITNKYKGAKIVCIGLTTNNGKIDYPNADTLVPQYNQVIKEISAKYGTLYVDQASVINPTNFLTYMHDDRVLHPNAIGHELIFREIVKVLYKDLTK